MSSFKKTVFLASAWVGWVCALPAASAEEGSAEGSRLEEAGAPDSTDLTDEIGILTITSDPMGAEVIMNGKSTCFTPCRLELVPSRLRLSLRHPERDEAAVIAVVTAGERTQVHSVLGETTPLKLIIPTYFVGAVFTAGGLSSILVHGNAGLGKSNLGEDERVFHRNLGVASVVIGVPLLALATYWVFAGKKGYTRISVAPTQPKVDVVPLSDARGIPVGLSLALNW